MSLHRHNPKRDKAESEVMETLLKLGALCILQISGKKQPDLAVYMSNGHWYMIEVKTDKEKLNKNQNWDETIEIGAVPVLRNAEEVIQWWEAKRGS